MSARKRRPRLEMLESRALQASAADFLNPVPSFVQSVINGKVAPALKGQVTGRYITDASPLHNAALPTTYHIVGNGRVQGFGMVDATGALLVGGFKAPNQFDEGVLTVSNRRGHLSLQLTGTIISGGENHLRVLTRGGAGRYKQMERKGSAVLWLGPNETQGAPSSSPQSGTFQLLVTLDSRHS